jgi:hypothetical protein
VVIDDVEYDAKPELMEAHDLCTSGSGKTAYPEYES